MKIISFVALKGGVGKTTLNYNVGEEFAARGKKVLFIDLDYQCNLSQTYDIYDQEGTVANIFRGTDEVTVHQVKPNLDLIAGYMRLDQIEKEVETKSYKDMLLYMWLEDNFEAKQLDQYDVIMIDCHPDFSTATRNAIIVSHAIISPVIPNDYGYQAKFNLEERIEEFKQEAFDFKTRESYVTAELYFVGNMIKHNTNSSRELVEALKKDDNVLAYIPHKELFNRSTLDKVSLSEMKVNKKLCQEHRKFFNEFDKMILTIEKTIQT